MDMLVYGQNFSESFFFPMLRAIGKSVNVRGKGTISEKTFTENLSELSVSTEKFYQKV